MIKSLTTASLGLLKRGVKKTLTTASLGLLKVESLKKETPVNSGLFFDYAAKKSIINENNAVILSITSEVF